LNQNSPDSIVIKCLQTEGIFKIGTHITNRCSCRLRLCLSIELWSIEAVVLADAAAQLNSMLCGFGELLSRFAGGRGPPGNGIECAGIAV
jgi:hypothetical protein